MPALLPIVAAFASGAVGAVIAGTAGIAAYATVAGAVLTGIGALTGKKDLTRLGAVLSIGGGLATAFGVGGGAAAGAEGAAAAALPDAAASVAGTISNAADVGAEAATPAIDTAMNGADAITPPQPTTTVPDGAPGSLAAAGRPAGVGQQPLSIANATQQTTAQPTLDSPITIASANAQPAAAVDPNSALGRYGASTSSNDLASWWERAKKAGSAVGDFMQKNPALVTVAGNALNGMYGPQAEQMQWQKSLYERARANLNSPVALARGGKP